ncbi:MAG: hypothetical protein ACPG7F_16415 [Aggregatilineales bacterium]
MTPKMYRYGLCLLLITLSAGVIMAQPGNGGGRPGGDVRPTRTAPQVTPPAIPTITVPDIEITAPAIDVDALAADAQLAWESYQLPDNIPTGVEDLEALLTDIELPYMLDTDAITISPQISEVAYAALTNFALTYLNITINPLFATEISGGRLANLSSTTQSSMDISTVSAMFPEDMQALLSNVPGTTYGALMADGGALLMVDVDCAASDRDCGLSTDNMYVEISEASLGAYALYRQNSVNSATDAEALLKNTYSALATMAFIPVDVSEGYAFTAISIDVLGFVSTAYYIGTYSADNHTVVYAIVATGRNDGSDAQTYLDMLLPEGF